MFTKRYVTSLSGDCQLSPGFFMLITSAGMLTRAESFFLVSPCLPPHCNSCNRFQKKRVSL
ncbi:MAG TPA: hypothetical protein DEF22_09735 [Leclercia adecarboxylata]|nr:hypothetical protein [Leclercia adecarboxylata]